MPTLKALQKGLPMQRVTAAPNVSSGIHVRRLLSVIALLLLSAAIVPDAEAKSFRVTLTKPGVAKPTTADCATSGPGVRRLRCRLYRTGALPGSRCDSGRAVYTMTIARRGRPRPGFTCIRKASRRLPRLGVGERFRSGPFVCRHLRVASLDQTTPWPKLTGGHEGRLRCRRGSGPAGFSYDVDGSVTTGHLG